MGDVTSTFRLTMSSCVAPRFSILGVHRQSPGCCISHHPSRRSYQWRIRSITQPQSSDREIRSESPDVKERETRSCSFNAILEEVRDTQSLGSRGEGWVLSVLLAWILLLFPPVHLFGLMTATGWILTIGGIVLFVSGLLSLGRNNFPLPHPRKEASFVQQGIYTHVRHPQYGGILLLSLGISAITHSEVRHPLVIHALLRAPLDSGPVLCAAVACVGAASEVRRACVERTIP